jgi:hypothetical protein
VKVKYNCNGCGLTQVWVEVPDRARALDVVAWVKIVGERVGIDHGARSPLCAEGKVDLWIPVDTQGETPIGGAGTPIPPEATATEAQGHSTLEEAYLARKGKPEPTLEEAYRKAKEAGDVILDGNRDEGDFIE